MPLYLIINNVGVSMNYFSALQTFIHVAELQSFNRAASELSIKRSTVSRHISGLEEHLHITLFNRTSRGLSLTEAGTLFFPKAKELLHNLAEAKAATMALNQHPSGQLKLTVPGAFCRHHVLKLIDKFFLSYPDIDIYLRYSTGQESLIGTETDLAICFGALNQSTIRARKLATHSYAAYASPSCLHRPGFPLHVQQLIASAFFIPSEIGWYWREGKGEWQETGTHRLPRLISREEEVLLERAKNNQGIVVLPEWLAFNALKAGELVKVFPQITFQPGREPTDIWLAYPHKKTVSSKVRAFIDFMIAEIGEKPYWLDSPTATEKQPQRHPLTE
ncbi:DNA-binding transcriptional LysR family regulator [Raoultella sp. BIGb0138]|uniref:LysR family transcriptional regulator n=1 Tax=Raoultella sp. BIGb0138 TaxID=2485115 RepID=UPI00104C0DE6|nr:LysR family transcriptional regulator [Raoultella sp. BIGb0138]TCW16474.1 DNA-binding transcriptional LysR family regulator [Raoultella sp. BIGb0138]